MQGTGTVPTVSAPYGKAMQPVGVDVSAADGGLGEVGLPALSALSVVAAVGQQEPPRATVRRHRTVVENAQIRLLEVRLYSVVIRCSSVAFTSRRQCVPPSFNGQGLF